MQYTLSSVTGCTPLDSQHTVTLRCFGSVAILEVYAGTGCAGPALYQGSSPSGGCASIPQLNTVYVVWCGDTPSTTPTATMTPLPSATPSPSSAAAWPQTNHDAQVCSVCSLCAYLHECECVTMRACGVCVYVCVCV